MKPINPTENQLYVLQRLNQRKIRFGRVAEWHALDFPTVTINACVKRGWVQKDTHGKLSLTDEGRAVLEAQKS